MNIFKIIIFISIILRCNLIYGNYSDRVFLYPFGIEYYRNNLCVNSFPKNIGSVVVITGENLKFLNNDLKAVKIQVGGFMCNNIKFNNEIGKIQCDFDEQQTSKLRYYSQVTITGLSNIDDVFIILDIQKINQCDQIIGQENLTCPSDCFDYKSTKISFLKTLPKDLELEIDFNNNGSTFSFEMTHVNCRISINGGPKKLWAFQPIFEPKPSINGGFISINISNVNFENENSNAYITIKQDSKKIKGIFKDKYPNGSSSSSSSYLFQFKVPKGIGRKEIEVLIGNQKCLSEFAYKVPEILCYDSQVVDDNTIGFKFQNTSGIMEWIPDHIDQIKIKFSNQTFYKNDIKIIQDQEHGTITLGIQYKDKYQRDYLTIEFCNITSSESLAKWWYHYPEEPLKSLFEIRPIIIHKDVDHKYMLGVNGGVVSLVVKLFSLEYVNDGPVLKCHGDEEIIEPKCSYVNNTLITCDVRPTTKSKNNLFCYFRDGNYLNIYFQNNY